MRWLTSPHKSCTAVCIFPDMLCISWLWADISSVVAAMLAILAFISSICLSRSLIDWMLELILGIVFSASFWLFSIWFFVDSERFLISLATTAKPLPASPALAASMLALSERSLLRYTRRQEYKFFLHALILLKVNSLIHHRTLKRHQHRDKLRLIFFYIIYYSGTGLADKAGLACLLNILDIGTGRAISSKANRIYTRHAQEPQTSEHYIAHRRSFDPTRI